MNGYYAKNNSIRNTINPKTIPSYNNNNMNSVNKNYSYAENFNLPDIQNFKTTKFLDKFKNKISVTGRDGFANIISTNSNDKIVNPEATLKPSKAKNLNDWKEAYQERKSV
jgi:hypothetical protein